MSVIKSRKKFAIASIKENNRHKTVVCDLLNNSMSKFPSNCRRVKMYCFIFLAIALMAGLSDASRECNEAIRETCKRGDDEFYIPETGEQLRENCNIMKRFLGCVKNVSGNCEDKSDYELSSKFLSVTEDMCNEDSLAYRGIVDNLLCLKGLINESYVCVWQVESNTVENYAALMEKRGIPYLGLTKEHSRFCMQHLQICGCSLYKISKGCGNTARNAAQEMLQKTLELSECREEVVNDFPDFVTYYANEEDKEDNSL